MFVVIYDGHFDTFGMDSERNRHSFHVTQGVSCSKTRLTCSVEAPVPEGPTDEEVAKAAEIKKAWHLGFWDPLKD